MAGLREALEECQTILSHLLSANPREVAQNTAGDSTAPPGTGDRKAGTMTDRAEAYRQLAQLADSLAQMEPHSPIPDLLRWAVKLGKMSFRDLIEELVREPNVLADIRRQFGIKIEESEKNG